MRFDCNRAWEAYLHDADMISPARLRFSAIRPDTCIPARYAAEHSDTAFLTDRLLHDLPSRGDGWCAHLTYIRPHPPFVAPAPYNNLVDPAAMPSAAPLSPIPSLRWPGKDLPPCQRYGGGFPDLEENAQTTAMMRAIYMGLVAELDHHFGRIVSWLRETGQYDSTTIIVTADHGEMLVISGLGQGALSGCCFSHPACHQAAESRRSDNGRSGCAAHRID